MRRGRALFKKGPEKEGCEPEISTGAENHKASSVFQAWELLPCFTLVDCLSLWGKNLFFIMSVANLYVP